MEGCARLVFCRGQTKPVGALCDHPGAGGGRFRAAQFDTPARRSRPWPRSGGRLVAAVCVIGNVTFDRRRQAGGCRNPPARARRAGLGALCALVEDQARDHARRRGELQAPRGLEVDRVEFRQHRGGRPGTQRFLEGPEALDAGAGLDHQEPGGRQPERCKSGRVEGRAARRDPDHRAAPGEAGEQGGRETLRRAVVFRPGDLVQATADDAAAELGIDGSDAQRHGARPRPGQAGAAGQRAARRPGLDRPDPGREGVAGGGA